MDRVSGLRFLSRNQPVAAINALPFLRNLVKLCATLHNQSGFSKSFESRLENCISTDENFFKPQTLRLCVFTLANSVIIDDSSNCVNRVLELQRQLDRVIIKLSRAELFDIAIEAFVARCSVWLRLLEASLPALCDTQLKCFCWHCPTWMGQMLKLLPNRPSDPSLFGLQSMLYFLDQIAEKLLLEPARDDSTLLLMQTVACFRHCQLIDRVLNSMHNHQQSTRFHSSSIDERVRFLHYDDDYEISKRLQQFVHKSKETLSTIQFSISRIDGCSPSLQISGDDVCVTIESLLASPIVLFPLEDLCPELLPQLRCIRSLLSKLTSPLSDAPSTQFASPAFRFLSLSTLDAFADMLEVEPAKRS